MPVEGAVEGVEKQQCALVGVGKPGELQFVEKQPQVAGLLCPSLAQGGGQSR